MHPADHQQNENARCRSGTKPRYCRSACAFFSGVGLRFRSWLIFHAWLRLVRFKWTNESCKLTVAARFSRTNGLQVHPMSLVADVQPRGDDCRHSPSDVSRTASECRYIGCPATIRPRLKRQTRQNRHLGLRVVAAGVGFRIRCGGRRPARRRVPDRRAAESRTRRHVDASPSSRDRSAGEPASAFVDASPSNPSTAIAHDRAMPSILLCLVRPARIGASTLDVVAASAG